MYGLWGYLLKAKALAPINAGRVLKGGWYLHSYEGDDENQARELSNIISGCKQTSDIQQQPANSSPNKDRLPLQASSSSNSFSTINNLTGTVNFYGAFSGFPGVCQCQLTKAQSHNVLGKGSELLYSQTQMRTSYCWLYKNFKFTPFLYSL